MYKFSLGVVLNHRKILEENLQKEFGLLNQKLADQKEKYDELERNKKEILENLSQKQASGMTVSESLLHVCFIEKVTQQQKNQTDLIKETEVQVNQKRDALIEAMKNRKVLEKLKEKGWEKYQVEMKRIEENFMNEMAAIRYHPDLKK